MLLSRFSHCGKFEFMYTVWELKDLSTSHILREINFVKIANFTIQAAIQCGFHTVEIMTIYCNLWQKLRES